MPEAGVRPTGEETPDYLGHRTRLRQRFLEAGADALADYELLELMLYPAILRRDTKPLAKALIRRFGDFAGVINADTDLLTKEPGVTPAVATALKSVQAAVHRVLRAETRKRSVLSDWQRVIDYCRALMMHQKVEEFRLLFLDTQNAVIADELQQTGTIDHTPVYPRKVVKRALELGAAAIIMVHNHPSGNPQPSAADKAMTKEIDKAVSAVGIKLHDHVIVGRDGHTSLKSMGFFEERAPFREEGSDIS